MCVKSVVEKTTVTANSNLRPGCALDSCCCPGRTLPHRRDPPTDDGRARDLIIERTAVDVDKNPRIIGLIKLSTEIARWIVRTTPGDLEVEALRVILCAVPFEPTVQSNDLVSKNVVSRGNVARDPHTPRVAILSQGTVGVFSRSTLRDEAHPINLEEFQLCLVHSLTWTVAVG